MGNELRKFDQEFTSLKERMNSLMDGFFGESLDDMKMPTTDIVELDNSFKILVELPGVSKEDISLNIENGHLFISAEHKHHVEDKKGEYTRIERKYKGFQRTIPLPNNASSSNVKAKYENGILEVILEKKKLEGSSQISIT